MTPEELLLRAAREAHPRWRPIKRWRFHRKVIKALNAHYAGMAATAKAVEEAQAQLWDSQNKAIDDLQNSKN